MNQKSFRFLVIGVNHFVFTLTLGIDLSDSSLDLVNCVVQVVRTVSERKIAFEYEPEHHSLVSQVLKRINVPVVLNTVEIRKPAGIELRLYSDLVLIFRDEPRDVVKETLWDGHTRFLLITTKRNNMEKYFEHFWMFKVINAFALLSNDDDVSLYSYLPYQSSNCSEFKVISVDSCVGGKLTGRGLALKDTMRVKNMNKCQVNITVTHTRPDVIFDSEKGRNDSSTAKGFEGNLIVEVAKVLNFKSNFKLPNDGVKWGWIHPKPRGAIGEVYLGISDITIGMVGPFVERYENLDFCNNYNLDACATFAVPEGYALKQPLWRTIFVSEFGLTTWILIALSFALISIVMWLINEYLNLNWFSGKTESVMLLFSSCLGVPINTPNYASTKTLIAFWITFTFIICVAYKGSMGSKLVAPPRDGNIQTFEDLIQSDLELTGYKNMIQILNKVDDSIFKKLIERFIFRNYSAENAVARIANHEKLANLQPESSFYYYAMINPKARGKVHVIKDCVFSYHPVVLAQKFSPLTSRVGQIIRRLEEAGIMQMWREKYLQTGPPPTKSFTSLTVKQMLGIFWFWIFGCGVASFSFFLEFYFFFFCPKILKNAKKKLQKQKQNKRLTMMKGNTREYKFN